MLVFKIMNLKENSKTKSFVNFMKDKRGSKKKKNKAFIGSDNGGKKY